MHSLSFDTKTNNKDGGDVLVSVATLITESRIPGNLKAKSKKFYEGPHCTLIKGTSKGHRCDLNNSLCLKFENDRKTVLNLYQKSLPLCIEVLLTCACTKLNGVVAHTSDNTFVLEQWHFNISIKRSLEPLFFNLNQLVSAIRSQLYFSQITAWLSTQDENSSINITEDNFRYLVTVPGKTFTKFQLSATKHEFPSTDIGNGLTLNVSFFSLPRTANIPNIICSNCSSKDNPMDLKNGLVDDRMHTSCTLKGKHRCEDFEEYDVKIENKLANIKRLCQNNAKCAKNNACEASTSKHPKLKVNVEKYNIFNLSKNDQKNEKRNISPNLEQKQKSAKLDGWHEGFGNRHNKNDLSKKLDKGQLLLDAIERCGRNSTNGTTGYDTCAKKSESDNANCDKSESDIFSIKKRNNFNIYVDNHCDSPIPITRKQIRDLSNVDITKLKPDRRAKVRQKLTFDDVDRSASSETCDRSSSGIRSKEGTVGVPSPSEQAKFRKNLDNAASMVFHSRTGLPLTSSPAPVRRGKSCFDFDSSLNSVSAIKSALFSSSFSTDDESESEGSIVSPCSPETYALPQSDVSPIKYRRKGHAANLLGSFEESVLNGRLEPVSTVHGFTAELGASGSFVPKHLAVPVTVFFYTLGDNDKVSSPYLGHINLGKKGYNVPKSGTVQVTLFNPLRTVVKMFVIMYDLSDMPPNSQTFIRQRTLYMPTNCKDTNLEWGPKWLRYLIHLRFMSSKSGKIYLHSDIRMIIFRKCDMDTATAHGIDMSYELRSFTHAPTNPRFSPRK
ncbi:protein FAM214A [Anoplophora glabripennis]|uniref:protein FAM214A n=2 Tax=Anoplophora glabripennis TaxID=217634 RepID=UPI00087526D4|nr:protein FAM214A [Anoplophora glabripennis]